MHFVFQKLPWLVGKAESLACVDLPGLDGNELPLVEQVKSLGVVLD